jgi:hypothetical protein
MTIHGLELQGLNKDQVYLLIVQGRKEERVSYEAAIRDLTEALGSQGVSCVVAAVPERLNIKALRVEDPADLLQSLEKLTEEIRRLRIVEESMAKKIVED